MIHPSIQPFDLRWAPPAPHLLPPLPPMSYELRCWIQALERAQNGTNGLNPGPFLFGEDDGDGEMRNFKGYMNNIYDIQDCTYRV